MLESKRQTAVKKYAESIGFIVIKTIRLSEAGHADLFMFRHGKTIFIEMKQPGQDLGPLQKIRQAQLRGTGFVYERCEDVKQFKEIIFKHG